MFQGVITGRVKFKQHQPLDANLQDLLPRPNGLQVVAVSVLALPPRQVFAALRCLASPASLWLVGAHYGLMLDPSPDAYFLFQAGFLSLPAVNESLARLRDLATLVS